MYKIKNLFCPNQQILDYYGYVIDVHIHMLIVFLPILLPSLVLNLKYLAIFSTIANICIGIGIAVVLYYVFQDLPTDLSDRKLIGDINTIPLYFGSAIYAFEGISLVSNKKNFLWKMNLILCNFIRCFH